MAKNANISLLGTLTRCLMQTGAEIEPGSRSWRIPAMNFDNSGTFTTAGGKLTTKYNFTRETIIETQLD